MGTGVCFVLGLPRSGTTALYHLLGQHPNLMVTNPKEPNIFSSHKGTFNRDPALPEVDYYKQYNHSDSTIVDFSVHTFHCPMAPARIRESFPDSKFCIIIRDPVDRIESHWKMIHKTGSSPLKNWSDFDEAWNNSNFRESAEYHKPMLRWLEEFQKDSFIIMNFEEFKSDFKNFSSRISKHFGCDDFDFSKIEPHMENRSNFIWSGWKKAIIKFYNKINPRYRRNVRIFVSKFFPIISKSFDNGTKENNLKLDDKQRKMLKNYIEDDYEDFRCLILSKFNVELPDIKG